MTASSETPIAVGELILDRYRVIEAIASGGHSVVYLGTDERLSRPVCIKVFSGLAGESGVGRTSYEHFVQEAFALSRLTHPNTLRIYDFGHLGPGTAPGTTERREMPLQVCEYMNGGTLSQLVREGGPQPLGETVRIIIAMCDALAEAHSLGIVHRDIKPQNILFGTVGASRLPKLADFGIAKWSADSEDSGRGNRAEDTAIVAGQKLAMYSPSWAAPEQLAGQPVSAVTDIYSLAAVAIYVLTGAAIFADEDVYAGYKKRRHAAELIHDVLAPLAVPPAVIDVLTHALAFDPKRRIPRVDAFAAALREAIEPDTNPVTLALEPAPTSRAFAPEPTAQLRARPLPPPPPGPAPLTSTAAPTVAPPVPPAAAPTPPAVFPNPGPTPPPSGVNYGPLPVVVAPWMATPRAPAGHGPHRLGLAELPVQVGDRRVHFVMAPSGVADLLGPQQIKIRVTLLPAPRGRVIHLRGMSCFVAPLGGRPSPAVQIDRDTDVALVTPRAQAIGHVQVQHGTPGPGQTLFQLGAEALIIAGEDCGDPLLFDFGPGSDAYFLYTQGRAIPRSPHRRGKPTMTNTPPAPPGGRRPPPSIPPPTPASPTRASTDAEGYVEFEGEPTSLNQHAYASPASSAAAPAPSPPQVQPPVMPAAYAPPPSYAAPAQPEYAPPADYGHPPPGEYGHPGHPGAMFPQGSPSLSHLGPPTPMTPSLSAQLQVPAVGQISQVSGVISQATPYVTRSRIYAFVVDETGHPIELGSGRFAKAYLGEERWVESKTTLRRPIAIKCLQKGVSGEDQMRFQMEKEILERVQGHPNIVELLGSGEGDSAGFIPPSVRDRVENDFMILELLDMSLEERLKGARQKRRRDDLLAVPMRERIFRVLEYVIPVATAVEFSHLVRDTCHRDIKPANILVKLPDPNLRGSQMRVKLADFNVGKVADPDHDVSMTRFQAVPGTLYFQSPEQETNTFELLINATQGSAEVDFFEDFYIDISENDTFSLFNRNEYYGIVSADRIRKKIVLNRPFAEGTEINVRGRVVKSVGRPADIYSLGAVFYYLISGAYANPKNLFDAFRKFVEYDKRDENNSIAAYIEHEYRTITNLRAPKPEGQGAAELAPEDRFFSFKHYLDGNGELIDPMIMMIIAKAMVRNKPDSYCLSYDLRTTGISAMVHDLLSLYVAYGIDPSARLAYNNDSYAAPKKTGAMRRAFDKIFGK